VKIIQSQKESLEPRKKGMSTKRMWKGTKQHMTCDEKGLRVVNTVDLKTEVKGGC